MNTDDTCHQFLPWHRPSLVAAAHRQRVPRAGERGKTLKARCILNDLCSVQGIDPGFPVWVALCHEVIGSVADIAEAAGHLRESAPHHKNKIYLECKLGDWCS